MYNKAKWSDLIIELGDGRAIHVDKNVFSQANDYYEDLCDRVNLRSSQPLYKSVTKVED